MQTTQEVSSDFAIVIKTCGTNSRKTTSKDGQCDQGVRVR